MGKTPRSKGGLGKTDIPLLADLTHQISKDYGVYLENAGHDLVDYSSLMVQGIVRHATLNDPPVGRSR